MRILDRFGRKIEPGHVKLYSRKEFQTLFERAGLRYITSRTIIPTIEIHVADRSDSNA